MILKLFDILKIEILHAATFVHLILDELNCIFHLLLISKLCVRITLNCKVGKPYIQLASNVKYVHLSEFIDKVKISR